jgi:hypothetical protein
MPLMVYPKTQETTAQYAQNFQNLVQNEQELEEM